MNIHTSLKNIRVGKGMTQEQVADKIGLTRQAISAYESGKRQPGLDILISLANFYNVEIEEILYGNKKKNYDRIIKLTAIIILSLFLILQTAAFSIEHQAYYRFGLETGIVLQDDLQLLDIHLKLMTVHNRIEYFSQILLYCGTTALLIIDLSLKNSYKTKNKILFSLLFFTAVIVNCAFWTLLNTGSFTQYNFIIIIFQSLFIPVIILFIDIFINESINFRKKA